MVATKERKGHKSPSTEHLRCSLRSFVAKLPEE